MNKITFYDTETTGLPEWKIPSGDEKQPHLVSLTAIQCDADTEKIIQRIDLIVKSEGWESQEKAFDAHGITKEHSIEVGLPEPLATRMLLELCRDSIRVSHNRTFDQRMIRIALKRYFDDIAIDQWAEKEDHKCTMLMAKPIMELPPYGRYGWKNPNLAEAYKFFTGKELQNAHSSSADTEACMEIYFAMQKYEKPEKKCNHKNWDVTKQDVCPDCKTDVPF
jgi:DNA polymerase-3 subunit epsilon